MITRIGTTSPARYLTVLLPEHALVTAGHERTAHALAATIDAALRLRESLRRALFSR